MFNRKDAAIPTKWNNNANHADNKGKRKASASTNLNDDGEHAYRTNSKELLASLDIALCASLDANEQEQEEERTAKSPASPLVPSVKHNNKTSLQPKARRRTNNEDEGEGEEAHLRTRSSTDPSASTAVASPKQQQRTRRPQSAKEVEEEAEVEVSDVDANGTHRSLLHEMDSAFNLCTLNQSSFASTKEEEEEDQQHRRRRPKKSTRITTAAATPRTQITDSSLRRQLKTTDQKLANLGVAFGNLRDLNRSMRQSISLRLSRLGEVVEGAGGGAADRAGGATHGTAYYSGLPPSAIYGDGQTTRRLYYKKRPVHPVYKQYHSHHHNSHIHAALQIPPQRPPLPLRRDYMNESLSRSQLSASALLRKYFAPFSEDENLSNDKGKALEERAIRKESAASSSDPPSTSSGSPSIIPAKLANSPRPRTSLLNVAATISPSASSSANKKADDEEERETPASLWESKLTHLVEKYREEEVNMSNLRLKELPFRLLFSAQRFLVSLDLSNNRIADLEASSSFASSSVSSIFAQLLSLKELNLSHNELASLPETLFRCPKLQMLDASHNRLTSIHLPATSILASLPLSDLVLSHNLLEDSPPELCLLPHLAGLGLDNNLLENFPPSSPYFPPSSSSSSSASSSNHTGWFASLIALDLSNNRLKEISPQLCHLTALQELTLSNNKLTYIREELELERLSENLLLLDLSHNLLRELGGPIASSKLCQLKELVTLSVQHNRLEYLPLEIWRLKNLRVLRLEGNPVATALMKEQQQTTKQILHWHRERYLLEKMKRNQQTSSSKTKEEKQKRKQQKKEEMTASKDIEQFLNMSDTNVYDLLVHLPQMQQEQMEREQQQKEEKEKEKKALKNPSDEVSSATANKEQIASPTREKRMTKSHQSFNNLNQIITRDPSSKANAAALRPSPGFYAPSMQSKRARMKHANSIILPCAEWRLCEEETEKKEEDKEEGRGENKQLKPSKEEKEFVLEGDENYLPHYKDYFVERAHTNFFGWDPVLGPMAISILKEKDNNPFNPSYWFLIRTQHGTEIGAIPTSLYKAHRSRISKYPSSSHLLSALRKMLKPNLDAAELYPVKGTEAQQALLELEQQMLVRAHKFGVIYCKEGQITADQMLNNVEGSDAFEEFLSFLGECIYLEDWKGYCGGLDVTKNKVSFDWTGRHSVFTNWRDLDVMFHVSTLLPFSLTDNRQTVRKHHIGSDVGVIVFVDGDTKFSPLSVASLINKVFAVVKAEKNPKDGTTQYRVAFTAKEEVPEFGPLLPCPPLFQANSVFRDLLLSKLVNGERAAYRSAELFQGIGQTRFILLSELAQRFLHPKKPSFTTMLAPGSLRSSHHLIKKQTKPTVALPTTETNKHEDLNINNTIDRVKEKDKERTEAIVQQEAEQLYSSVGLYTSVDLTASDEEADEEENDDDEQINDDDYDDDDEEFFSNISGISEAEEEHYHRRSNFYFYDDVVGNEEYEEEEEYDYENTYGRVDTELLKREMARREMERELWRREMLMNSNIANSSDEEYLASLDRFHPRLAYAASSSRNSSASSSSPSNERRTRRRDGGGDKDRKKLPPVPPPRRIKAHLTPNEKLIGLFKPPRPSRSK